MKTKDELKNDILALFKSAKCRVDDVILLRTIQFGIMAQLNSIEREALNAALDELIRDRVIVYESSRPECVRLTRKGFELIYAQSNLGQTYEKIILDMFKRQDFRVGGILTLRSIRFTYLLNLNPIEQDNFFEACENLINKGFITYIPSPIEVFRLESKGFEVIVHNTNIHNFLQ